MISNRSRCCTSHIDKPLTQVCFMNSCYDKQLLCDVCLVESHKQCEKRMIVSLSDLSDKVFVQPHKNKYPNKKQLLINKINRYRQVFFKRLNKWEKGVLSIFDEKLQVKNMNLKQLTNLRNTHKMYWCNKKEKIILNPKINIYSEDKIDDFLDDLSNEIKQTLENSAFRIEKTRLFNSQIELKEVSSFEKSISVSDSIMSQKSIILETLNSMPMFRDDWLNHKHIKVTQQGNAIRFERSDISQEKSFCLAIYGKPLVNYCKFKMTIKNLDENFRHLPIGMMDQEGYTKSKATLKNFKGFFTVYYGYNSQKNMKGKAPTKSPSDAKGHAIGKEYFIEMFPKSILKIYNEEKSVDLSGSLQGRQGPFYLSLMLFKPKAACIIECLI